MTTIVSRVRRKRRVQRVLGVGVLLLGGLVAVLAYNTLRMAPSPVSVPSGLLIAVDANAAAARLAAALRFPTIAQQEAAQTDTTAFLDLHAFLADTFPRVHAALTRGVVADLSLLYTWPGTNPSLPPVVLLGHLDVVPVDTNAAWTHPPFGGHVRDGYIWGRGALDDKAGVLGALEAVEQLLADGFAPTRTVYLAFGHDEEVGGRGAQAMAALLAGRGVRPLFVLDEGGAILQGVMPGLSLPVAVIGIAEKGYVSIEMSVEAEGGHSSRPPAETAIGMMSRAVARLEADPFPARLDGPTAALFDRIAPHLSLPRRVVFANRWLLDPVLVRLLAADPSTAATIRTTTAPTLFHSGTKENVLPTRATAVVNLRLMPGTSIDAAVARVRETIDDPRVQLRVLESARNEASPVASTTSAGFLLLEQSLREVYEGDALVVAPYLVTGGTDARHYTGLTPDVYRFTATTMRPDDLARFHGTDERLAVDDYARVIRFYYQLLRNAQQAP